MAHDPAAIAATYMRAWKERDFETLRSLLADDVTFSGPLAELSNADDCVAGLRRMSEIMTDIVIRKRLADDTDAITWFDLHTSVAPPVPTANWSHVEDGKITSIRVAFDARPLAPPDGQ
jgi:SnoaL-like domain